MEVRIFKSSEFRDVLRKQNFIFQKCMGRIVSDLASKHPSTYVEGRKK